MLNSGSKVIETQRLILRRFRKEDAEAIYDNWQSDSMVCRYLTWLPYSSLSLTRAYLDSILKDYRRAGSYHWCILLKETMAPVGSIDVVRQIPAIEAAEVGYLIMRPLWNKGYATEALESVVAYLFTEEGFNRIEACHHIKNLASGHVMEKVGMRFEGITRDGVRDNRGILCDIARYAILRKDFIQRRAESLRGG